MLWGTERGGGVVTNHYIRNNIFKSSVEPAIRFDNPGDYIIDYNNYDCAKIGESATKNAVYTTLLQWQTASGKDAHSVNADPHFVSSSDFNLDSTSVAIDAGIYVGKPFSGTAPDMGAHEFNNGDNHLPSDTSIVMPPIVGTIIQPTFTVATGSVVLNGLPATGTWTLTKTPGGTTMRGTGTSFTITDLAPLTYTFTVTDGTSGYTSESSGNVVIIARPSAPTIGSITQPTCSLATGGVELFGLPGGTWTLTRTPGGITTTGTGTWSLITGLEAGTYTFSVTKALGYTSVESANVVINIQTQRPAPIITLEGNILHSESIYGNQWYDQKGFIDGANFQDYKATATGDYYTIVSDDECTSNPSNTIHVIITGIDIVENKSSFNGYPNPVTNELNIELKGNTINKGFEIINSIGQIVFNGIVLEKTVVQMVSFSPGTYLIKLEKDHSFEFKTIVKR